MYARDIIIRIIDCVKHTRSTTIVEVFATIIEEYQWEHSRFLVFSRAPVPLGASKRIQAHASAS